MDEKRMGEIALAIDRNNIVNAQYCFNFEINNEEIGERAKKIGIPEKELRLYYKILFEEREKRLESL